jgi:hypothetical protein
MFVEKEATKEEFGPDALPGLARQNDSLDKRCVMNTTIAIEMEKNKRRQTFLVA